MRTRSIARNAALLVALVPAAMSCRIFFDENAPCADNDDCAPDERCVDARCAAGAAEEDAGPNEDEDAGAPDAGSRGDGGVVDAGVDVDAGQDAGFVDAGAPDAGIDAGFVDAGFVDAGVECAPTSACPADVYDADVTGDCVPDLIVGAPGVLLPEAAWADAGPAEPKGYCNVYAGTGGTALGGASRLFNAQARAGFCSSLAAAPVPAANGRRWFIVGEPGPTRIGTTPVATGALWWFLPVDLLTFPSHVFAAGGLSETGASTAVVGSADTTPLFFAGAPATFVPTAPAAHGSVFAVTPQETSPFYAAQARYDASTDFSGPGFFGEELRTLHDVNGDCLPELGASAVSLDSGADFGVVAFDVGNVDAAAFTIVSRWSSPATAERFGAAFASVGDLAGSAAPDVAIGAPWAAPAGALFLASALDASSYDMVSPPAAASAGAAFGASIEPLGDLDGDGLPEVLVGAPFHSTGTVDGGVDPAMCDDEAAPPGYAGDCAGAIVVVPGALWSGSTDGGVPVVSDTCFRAGNAGDRYGTALRAWSRTTPTGPGGARVAIGAPGVQGFNGRFEIVTVSMTSPTTCQFAFVSEKVGDDVNGRLGAAFAR